MICFFLQDSSLFKFNLFITRGSFYNSEFLSCFMSRKYDLDVKRSGLWRQKARKRYSSVFLVFVQNARKYKDWKVYSHIAIYCCRMEMFYWYETICIIWHLKFDIRHSLTMITFWFSLWMWYDFASWVCKCLINVRMLYKVIVSWIRMARLHPPPSSKHPQTSILSFLARLFSSQTIRQFSISLSRLCLLILYSL
jgi:hypothetical protein